MKTHTLHLTLGSCLLAQSILAVPNTFKTPKEIVAASNLIHKLTVPDLPEKPKKEQLTQECEVEVSETERDTLKQACTHNAGVIPPGPHAAKLLIELGLAE